ncbi:conserved hypothetical protein [Histoplasma mississippiense (nom. inval.)]|nr:conserved hypothetical protein [Histoplasma mississippiense (nom. inval.)]EDN09180.1 conserved hypothetical protein [Histoplasma mississippiense (nom. inval.)]
MEPSTPSRPPKDIDTAYTRPLEPESPANFVAGKAGKRQRKTVTMPPPVLKGASDSIPTATSRLQKQFEEAQQQQNLQQKALIRLAKTLDSWVEEEKQSVSQNFARIFCERFVKYVTADLSAASILRGGAAPDTHPQPNAAKTAAREPTTWAGVAQRGKNSALPGVAPAKTAASSAGRASGASLQPKSASQPGGPTGGTKQQEDPRVLVTLQPEKRVARLQPYAVRQAIAANIQGVGDVANVPKVEPTRTGWAITPSDRGIRDALTTEKAVATLCEVLGAMEIRLPERWYNYAVPGVPEFVQDWEGARIPTDKMVEGEVLAQAKVKPDARGSATHQSVRDWQDAPTAVPQGCSGAATAASTASTNGRSGGAYTNHSVNPVNTARWAGTPQAGGDSEFHHMQMAGLEVFNLIPQVDFGSSSPNRWDDTNPEQREEERPRVMTYVRKGSKTRAQQHRSVQSRDLLWVSVNGCHILNVYRQPGTDAVMDYLTNLSPPARCLIGGDINVRHDAFEPGAVNLHRGGELVQWASEHGMDFVGEIGVPTHATGHVIDLTFSNVTFASTTVRQDLHCGSDHQSMVTVLPTTPQTQLSDARIKITDSQLEPFADLVRGLMVDMPCPEGVGNVAQLDDLAQHFTQSLLAAAQAVSKPAQQGRTTAPWWTADCRRAHRELTTHQTEAAKHQFKDTVRKAKRAYWRQVINEARDGRDLYRVVAWHKLEPNLRAPPLVIGDQVIEETAAKAEALQQAILKRYNSADDLEYDPLDDEHWSGMGNLPWNPRVGMEEVERNTIGVQNTSPGTDGITVRMLKACWQHVSLFIQQIYNCCLRLCHFPRAWKLAEVAMIPKVGKRDRISVRSWRPIALLSVISKGLERIMARRLAYTALIHGIVSPQHGGALPRRSAMDLVAAFTHEVEAAFAQNKEVSMVTMDVQGAFDAVLRRRLLQRMAQQGWPRELLQLIDSFLTECRAQVRLEGTTTAAHQMQCGTPQGSPLSPILFLLYLAELLWQNSELRFGYADDLNIWRATHSLDNNATLLRQDIQSILRWGEINKVAFAPEKLEMIHLTRKRYNEAPAVVVSEDLTVHPVTAPAGQEPALRWLGVHFDRRLTWRPHVSTRAKKARAVAQHIRSLGKTRDGPPADALRKAVTTCVVPSLLYGTEAWYGGRTQPARHTGRSGEVSSRLGWHVGTVEKVLTMAARGVLPVFRTTPIATLYRDAGLPSAMVALEEAKMRFATRLQVVDEKHPLASRIAPPMITRGRGAGTRQRSKTKIQRLGALLPAVNRPTLAIPHYSEGCGTDPTEGVDKKSAAQAFKKWWRSQPSTDLYVFSDGSERSLDNSRQVGYGFIVYQGNKQLASFSAALSPMSHVFDAEAVGACRALECAVKLLPCVTEDSSNPQIWLCLDNTSVIWGIRGSAAASSNWAYNRCHELLRQHNVGLKWAPGHMGIEGNEEADRLAKRAVSSTAAPAYGLEATPTVSGVRTVAKQLSQEARRKWWSGACGKLSDWYRGWSFSRPTVEYQVKAPPELTMPRHALHRWLALRSSHGDFSWYHRRFQHADARLTCVCGHNKSPEHLVLCRHSQRHFLHWPKRPAARPHNRATAVAYLGSLTPTDFVELLDCTQFYTRYCTR